MRTSNRASRLALVVLIILGSLACQAQSYNVLAMSDFIGMTKQELAKLRSVPGFLNWTATLPTKRGTETEQYVSWSYADGSRMKMVLLDGKTVLAIHAGASNIFEGSEAILDKSLTPSGHHRWLDREKNVWELSRSGNIAGLQVSSPVRVPKLPSQVRSHSKPSPAARTGTGFWYSAYIGMTVPELSAVFRKTPHARGWEHFTDGRAKNNLMERVEWYYSDVDFRHITITLRNGRATILTLFETDAPISDFQRAESLLNRNFRAEDAHSWVDDARKIEWSLTFEEDSRHEPGRGTYQVLVAESKNFKH